MVNSVTLFDLESACSRPLFGRAIVTRKVGHTDLVFVVQLGFIGISKNILVCFSGSRCIYV